MQDIKRQLNARAVRPFARSLPWPYSGMINDLISAIQTGSNFLAALGLTAYTEVCGRQIIHNGDENKNYEICYNSFLEYMGLQEVLKWKITYKGKRKSIKNAIRNGLVHEYFLKVDSGAVAMISTISEANRLGFLQKKDSELIMVVVPYFRLFCEALRKAKKENRLKWSSK